MAERRVLNASPLIVLAKVNHQHLLRQLAGEIAIPQAVLTEIEAIQAQGFHLNDEVIRLALRETVGESWE